MSKRQRDKHYLIMKAWLNSVSDEKVKQAKKYFNKLNK
jgi:hypothetical protein